jgi:hypothetical protein
MRNRNRLSVVEVHQQGAGGLSGPRTGRVCGHSDQMCPAGAMLDRDQHVDPSEHHGVYGQEVHRQDGLGLRSEELSPGRTRPAWSRVEAGVVRDLPHGGGGDAVAEPDQFALHAPMSHVGFSAAMRMISFLIAVAIRGRPDRRRAV